MKIVKVNLDNEDESKEAITLAVRVLKRGGVVMHPTETCYGLAVDIFNEKALEKLYALKKMAKSKPVSVMVGSLEEAEKYADFGVTCSTATGSMINPRELADKYWPGPLTLVLPRKDALPVFLNEGVESVGLRCPDCLLCRDLIDGFSGPLTTTSANLTQWPEVYDVECYLGQLEGEPLRPDLIIDAGKLVKNRPSTIIKFEKGEMSLMREGVLWAQIRSESF